MHVRPQPLHLFADPFEAPAPRADHDEVRAIAHHRPGLEQRGQVLAGLDGADKKDEAVRQPELGPEWKPERSKVILSWHSDRVGGGSRLAVIVDPSHPSAWRNPPIYQKLKQWAFQGGPTVSRPLQLLVTVKSAGRLFVILPDQDIDVGTLADDEVIVTNEKMTSRGIAVEVRKVKRSEAQAVS